MVVSNSEGAKDGIVWLLSSSVLRVIISTFIW